MLPKASAVQIAASTAATVTGNQVEWMLSPSAQQTSATWRISSIEGLLMPRSARQRGNPTPLQKFLNLPDGRARPSFQNQLDEDAEGHDLAMHFANG